MYPNNNLTVLVFYNRYSRSQFNIQSVLVSLYNRNKYSFTSYPLHTRSKQTDLDYLRARGWFKTFINPTDWP